MTKLVLTTGRWTSMSCFALLYYGSTFTFLSNFSFLKIPLATKTKPVNRPFSSIHPQSRQFEMTSDLHCWSESATSRTLWTWMLPLSFQCHRAARSTVGRVGIRDPSSWRDGVELAATPFPASFPASDRNDPGERCGRATGDLVQLVAL